jgi:hypothetical protein
MMLANMVESVVNNMNNRDVEIELTVEGSNESAKF